MWLSSTQVSQTYAQVRRCLQMNDQKGRRSRRSYSILLDTPRGRFTPRSEPHQLTAERLTQLCGAGAPFRLLFVVPFRRSLFRGAKTSLSPLAQTYQNNRVSIGKTAEGVNSIPLWKTLDDVGELRFVPTRTAALRLRSNRPLDRGRCEAGHGPGPWRSGTRTASECPSRKA